MYLCLTGNAGSLESVKVLIMLSDIIACYFENRKENLKCIL